MKGLIWKNVGRKLKSKKGYFMITDIDLGDELRGRKTFF